MICETAIGARIRHAALPALAGGVLCALLAIPAVAQQAEPEQRKVPGRETTAEPTRQQPVPQGLTVLVPGWVPPADPRGFPTGITVLRGPAPARPEADQRTRSEVSIVVVPSPPAGELAGPPKPEAAEEGFDLVDEAERLQPGEEDPPESMSPTAEQQLAAFPREASPGGSPIPSWIGWQPTEAYADRDPGKPYPWNPAEFDEPWEGARWEPEEAFPQRDPRRPYPWNPADPPRVSGSSVWQPTDAWGRQMGRSEVIIPWRDRSQDGPEPPAGAAAEEPAP